MLICFFFFNDPATTEIYTLSLHDALPILLAYQQKESTARVASIMENTNISSNSRFRSEERFSRNAETDLVCRLLLEKKKKNTLTALSFFTDFTDTAPQPPPNPAWPARRPS